MSEFFTSAPTLLLAVLGAYMLGALPLADQISRHSGVDIFSVGSGLAGAGNVRKNVGAWPGVVVLIGDIGKGALAVLFAGLVGIEGPWIVVPAAAAIVGHWYSVFSGFRGGDGMAVLGGITIALFSVYGGIAVIVGLLVASGGQRLSHGTVVGVVFSYAALVMATVAYEVDVVPVLGVGGLTAMVLARSGVGHVHRRHAEGWDDEAAELADGDGSIQV
jgi:glycerol-3-phosphate acyltransferase PlsY